MDWSRSRAWPLGGISLLLLSTLGLLPSCGGGSGGDAGTLLVVVGEPNLDGTIQLDSITGQCEINAIPSNLVRSGENESSGAKFHTYWGFVTFDHSSLPPDATINSAIANIRMVLAAGDNLFEGGLFGNVVMEHIDIGTSLNEDDMTSPSLSGELVGGDASPTFLAVDSTLEFKRADISDEVRRDISDGRTRTTLRISFQVREATDADLADDFVEFVPFNAGGGNNQNRPFLELRFEE